MSGKILLALCALAAHPALAFDFGEYSANLQTEPGRAAVRVWLDGFGSGIGNYEAHQTADHRARRFCPPQGVRFSPELLAGLIDKTVNDQPTLAKSAVPVAAIIWVGLERSFPCKARVTG